MAHLIKINRNEKGGVKKLMGHCMRERSGEGLRYRPHHSDIDLERSELNRSFFRQPKPRRYLDSTIERLKPRRKDSVIACSWVVTLPEQMKGYDYIEQQTFLQGCYQFIESRYGKENMLIAESHFDETTPHCHTIFMPVKEGKFNARAILTPQEMRAFHKDLCDYMYEFCQKAGIRYERNWLNSGDKTTRNLNKAQLKISNEVMRLERTAHFLPDLTNITDLAVKSLIERGYAVDDKMTFQELNELAGEALSDIRREQGLSPRRRKEKYSDFDLD